METNYGGKLTETQREEAMTLGMDSSLCGEGGLSTGGGASSYILMLGG